MVVPTALGVNVTEQVPADNVQLAELKVPAAPALVKATVPVGVMAVPGEVSVTVAVHVVGWLIATVEGEHTTVVEVVRSVTVIVVVPELARWFVSPG